MRKDNDYNWLDGLGNNVDTQSSKQDKKKDLEVKKRLADTKKRLGIGQNSGGETGFAVFSTMHPEGDQSEFSEEFNSEKEIESNVTGPSRQSIPEYEEPLNLGEWEKQGTIKNSSTGGGVSLTPSRTPTEYRTDYKTKSEERTKGGFKIKRTPKKAEYTSGDIVTQEDKDYTVMESTEPGKLKVKDEETGEEKIVSEELVEPKIAAAKLYEFGDVVEIQDFINNMNPGEKLNVGKNNSHRMKSGETVSVKLKDNKLEIIRVVMGPKTADIQSVSFEDFWAIAAAPGSKAKKFKEFLIFMKDSLSEINQKVIGLNMDELKEKGLYDAIKKTYEKWQVTQPTEALEGITKEIPPEEEIEKVKETVKETPIEDIFKEPSEIPKEEKPELKPGMEASRKISEQLTKEQFRAQFPHEIELSDEQKEMMHFDSEFQGYKTYYLLNKMIIEDNGKFYCSASKEKTTGKKKIKSYQQLRKKGQTPSVPGSSAPVQEEHAKVTQRETQPSTTVVTDKEEPKQYLSPEEQQQTQRKPGVFEEFVNEIFTDPDVAVNIVKKMLDKAKMDPNILSRLESKLPKVPSNPSSEFWKQNGKKLAMTIFFEIERMKVREV